MSPATAWEPPKSKARWSAHDAVSEAAVVGYPHDIKGQGIYCYVTLMEGQEGDDALRKALVAHVRHEIGPIASPDKIQFAPGLPKTRSGKIMRRILRKIAEDDDLQNKKSNLRGDTSTLADPEGGVQLNWPGSGKRRCRVSLTT
jgi:acetyl-CoA synthetase